MQDNENREITYYTLLNRSSQRHIEEMADTMPQEDFIKLEYEEKWLEHLWVTANNEAFLNHIRQIKDIVKLDYTLREQIKSYARKNGEGNEQHKGDLYHTYISRKNWLSQTIFICKDEYKKTTNEVFYEVVKWCESWQNEWLEHFNPSKIEVMENGNPTTTVTEDKGIFLTYREIAILYYLNGIELTYDNADSIALYHGQLSRTRGKQLMEKYYTPITKEVEMLSNNKYNSEIYTYQNSFETLTKIIPLLKTDESKTLANEYLKKSISYRKVKR